MGFKLLDIDNYLCLDCFSKEGVISVAKSPGGSFISNTEVIIK